MVYLKTWYATLFSITKSKQSWSLRFALTAGQTIKNKVLSEKEGSPYL
jgi:hypothetical protein